MWSEAAPAQEPEFQFDETPLSDSTLDMPNLGFDLDETAALPTSAPVLASRSAWDDADEEPAAPPPPPVSKMPAWDTPPTASVVPIPAPIEPPAEATQEQWGFDEAQIETARRAAETPKVKAAPIARGKVKEGGKRVGLLIALLVILVLAGAAYGGFWWWKKQQERPAELVAAVPTRPQPTPSATTTTAPPAETGTIVEVPVTATETTATTATVATTTTQAPAPAPMTITAAPPAPVPAPAEALPVVRPRTTTAPTTAATPGRARYDEMARQYAANPQGNFTVQIQILCDPGNLEKAMRAGGDNLWFVPQPLGERSCYRLYWGHYNTRDEAQRALANVPASLRDRNSAVKALTR